MVHLSASGYLGFFVRGVFTLNLCVSSLASAGVLSDFEKDATHSEDGKTPSSGTSQPSHVTQGTKSNSTSNSSRSTGESCRSGHECSPVSHYSQNQEPEHNGFGELMFKLIFGLMGAGGVNSFDYAMGGATQSGMPHREKGDALVPFARLDAGRHFVSQTVGGSDWRAQAGIGPFALNFRYNTYQEKNETQDLTLQQWQLAYRMLATQNVGIGLWMGGSHLTGNESHSGFSIHLPVDWRLASRFVLTLDLGAHMYHRGGLSDNALELRYGMRYASLYGGYRWMATENKDLNGPILGLSFYY